MEFFIINVSKSFNFVNSNYNHKTVKIIDGKKLWKEENKPNYIFNYRNIFTSDLKSKFKGRN